MVDTILEYQKALTIIREGYDPVRVCLRLAKKDPALFNKLVNDDDVLVNADESVSDDPDKEFSEKVRYIYDTEGSISAIMMVRSTKKCTLKEAKEFVDYTMGFRRF